MAIPALPPAPNRGLQTRLVFSQTTDAFLAALTPWGLAANQLADDMNAAAAIVGAVSADLVSVAAITAELTNVAGISAEVVILAGIADDIGTVSSIATDVSAVAEASAAIQTCALNIGGILAAPGHASAAAVSASQAHDYAQAAGDSLSAAQMIEAALTVIAAGGNIYLTKAAMTAAASTIDANGFALVFIDESAANHSVVYQKQSGVMVAVFDLSVGSPPAWGNITGSLAAQTDLQAAFNAKAPIASPALTGTPTAPTAGAGTNTTQIATTAFVRAEVAALVAAAPSQLDTLDELAAALNDDPAFASTMISLLALKASLTGAETLTNKRLVRRVVTAGATSGTLTANSDTTDRMKAFGLTGGVNFANPTGTPTDQQQLVIHAKDDGTSRAISWGSAFAAAKNLALPAATTAGKWLKACFEWSSDDSKWVLVALVEQA